jgi:chromosome segregation ATPase
MTTAIDDLTTLRERRRQLSDRLEDIRTEQREIADDLAAARTDWADAVECGEDTDLLAERVHLHERGLADRGHAAGHLEALLADVDRQITDIESRERLATEVQTYHEARIDYSASLPDLPDALPEAVAAVRAALASLLGTVDGARAECERLTGAAAQLRQRAALLGVDVLAPDPEAWTGTLERACPKDTPSRTLMLAIIQRRGAHAVLAEIEQLIRLGLDDQRRALR